MKLQSYITRCQISIRSFMSKYNNDRGDVGVKTVAVTVAVIILVGVGLTAIKGLLPDFIGKFWDEMYDKITSWFN